MSLSNKNNFSLNRGEITGKDIKLNNSYANKTDFQEKIQTTEKNYNNVSNNNNAFYIIIIAILAIAIIILFVFLIIFNDKYSKLDEKYETVKNELEESYWSEDDSKTKLKLCFEEAERSRTNLWNANCPDGETECSLPIDTIDWIDSRYEQDIENCNSLYN